MAQAPAAWAGSKQPFFARTGHKIGLQLYTLGDEPAKDLDGVLARLAGIGYKDLELPGLLGKSAADLKAAASRAGVSFSCIHLSPLAFPGNDGFVLNAEPQKIVDTLGTLGITDVVVPLPPLPENFAPKEGESLPDAIARALVETGADGYKKTAAMLNAKAAALKPHGIRMGYHNHNVEFAKIGDTTGWDILVQETDPALIFFEIDLGWVVAAGLDPAKFLKQHKNRARWVHMKDVQASTKANVTLKMDPTEVGSGQINWSRVLKAAHKAGVERYYVEQEAPFAIARMEAVTKSHAFLSGVK